MTKLLLDAGEIRPEARPARNRRLRRLLLLLCVTLLCGGFYLAGIWFGMQGRMTCTVTSPGRIVCGSDADEAPPAQPALPAQRSGSA